MGHTYNERAPFVHSEHTSQHHASHNSHEKEVYNFKRKVDWLCRRLHHKAWKKEERTPTLSHSLALRITEVTDEEAELHLVSLSY